MEAFIGYAFQALLIGSLVLFAFVHAFQTLPEPGQLDEEACARADAAIAQRQLDLESDVRAKISSAARPADNTRKSLNLILEKAT